MMIAGMPTLTPPDSSVDAYIPAVDDSVRREDCRRLVTMMQQATGERPKMFARLGKHKSGKGRLYINWLSDVDPAVLAALLAKTAAARQAAK